VFESARTIAKGEKIERWQKILLAAMKQSLRAWIPQISFVNSFSELMKLNGSKIIFEQHSEIQFKDFLSTINFPLSTHNYFVFGPEGGLTDEECRTVNEECRVKLTDNRLRSETAIITAASLLNSIQSHA
jgi:16S rRNA (uracil1498-N3)-methyltransferase